MRNSKEINIILLLWGLIFVVISAFFREYVRYYLYLSIIIIIPIMILNMIRQRREDKLNGTKIFQASIYRMLIMAAVLLVFFFITKQNHT
ncbi:hypothetical protein DMB65_18110 [Flavobacterium cheongpyeongense]|uniref:Uncharacterized protein n=1 Tax=Flavobacterium cheongpyeongense TaxID=2212651 RepID=A0A2V4BKC9_9FLAO|nr:hypothetical protein DMB65_18110 [Flavobacterium cheongpyeongense]